MKKKVVSKITKISQKKIKIQLAQQPLFGLKNDRYINEPKKLVSSNQNKLKLVHWNVNGLRAILKKGVLDHYFSNFDIICLSETKIDLQKLKHEGVQLNNLWYGKFNQYWSFSTVKKGYSGCVVFSKIRPLNVKYGIGQEKFDKEGRFNVIEFEDFYLVNVYVPNSKRGLLRLNERVDEFDLEFRKFLNKLKQKKMLIVVGDFNVAHKEIDIADPKNNKKSAGFTIEERESFTKLLETGLVDVWRKTHKDVVQYSWWSNLSKQKNRADRKGWRIDYCLVDNNNEDCVSKTELRDDILGSDHCPLEVYLKFDNKKQIIEEDKLKEKEKINDDNQQIDINEENKNNQNINNEFNKDCCDNNQDKDDQNNKEAQNDSKNQSKKQIQNDKQVLNNILNKKQNLDADQNQEEIINKCKEFKSEEVTSKIQKIDPQKKEILKLNSQEDNVKEIQSLKDFQKQEQNLKILESQDSHTNQNSMTFKNFQSEKQNNLSLNSNGSNIQNSSQQNKKRYSNNFQTDKAYHRKKFSFKKNQEDDDQTLNIDQFNLKFNQFIQQFQLYQCFVFD